MALSDAGIRVSLLQAMRASPWTEHKLVLQEFVITPAGRDLLAAAAKTAGVTPAALFKTIADSAPWKDL